MISFIKGILVSISESIAIIENGGIGYQVQIPMTVNGKVRMGEEVKIYTYMQVREDDLKLFGFLTEEEKEIFIALIGVNGIGPKVALSVLSTLSVYDLKIAIMSEDAKTIAKTPGLGPKGAKKMILELRDRFDMEQTFGLTDETGDLDVTDDAVAITAAGLVSLGYSNAEALTAIGKVENATSYNPDQLLKLALKKLI